MLLRFTPIYQQRVWGGRQLESRFQRALPADGLPYGESWELVDRPEAQSVVATPGRWQGVCLHDLWTTHRAEIFGSQAPESPRFPLLLKILDAREVLSLQVHPPAEKAEVLGGEPKTEMWVMAAVEPGAKLYAGVEPGTTRESFAAALAAETAEHLVPSLHPSAGDFIFIPSGRLHAIGAGFLIFEIQQNSDTTYRVYDWGRRGLDGKPRQLHVEQSLDSIDFTDKAPELGRATPEGVLVACPYFQVRQMRLAPGESAPWPAAAGTASVGIVLDGVGAFETDSEERLASGDHVLLTAGHGPACIQASASDPLWVLCVELVG